MNWARGFRRLEIVLLVVFTIIGGLFGFSCRDRGKIGELENQLWHEKFDLNISEISETRRQELSQVGFTEKEISDYYSETEIAERVKTLENKIMQEKSRYFHRILSSLPTVLIGGLAGYLFI